MNDTLFEKDVILVNKLSYGPICPFFINQFLKKTEDYEKIRLSGLDRVKQGDVLVFEDTKDGFFFVKRCIGRSGDIFEISNGDIYVNNNLYVEPKTVKELYSFKVRNIHGLLDKCDSLGVSIQKSSKGRYIAFLSSKSIEIIKNDIDSLKEESNVFNKGTDNRLFPSLMRKSLIYGWNLNNYGPILIPQKGMSIELDDYNFMIYMSTLTKYEEVKVEKKGKNIYLNGKISSKYTFKRNYYFVIGDNRKQSYDSRFFGFLPEEEIVGKVSCVLFSKKDNSLQLNRIFKKV